jgi:intracellular multiplication protein IcmJ
MASKQLPLVLSVKTLNWRMNDRNSQEADQEFQRVKKKALERDNHTCRFCGFRAMKWQEVHHFNDDHADNSLENLVTACIYCHMVQHIGLAGASREAILIYRPEITQAQLHNLVRTAQVAERAFEQMKAEEAVRKNPNLKVTGEAAEMGKSLMASLKASADGARQHVLTSDPADLANALMLIPDEAYARRKEALAGIRLLPLGVRNSGSENQMTAIVDSWRAVGGPYATLTPNTWRALLKQFT